MPLLSVALKSNDRNRNLLYHQSTQVKRCKVLVLYKYMTSNTQLLGELPPGPRAGICPPHPLGHRPQIPNSVSFHMSWIHHSSNYLSLFDYIPVIRTWLRFLWVAPLVTQPTVSNGLSNFKALTPTRENCHQRAVGDFPLPSLYHLASEHWCKGYCSYYSGSLMSLLSYQ